jgi:hypothetical protein
MAFIATAAIFTGAFPAPPPQPEALMSVVAQLTRLSNYVVNDDTAFPYDHAFVLDTDYATWAGEGEPLVVVQAGWYWVWLNDTTLGTNYGGANNSDWLHAVGRNGITLNDTVFSQRHTGANAASAQLMSGGSPVYLQAGDELRTYFQNCVAGQTTLLVESNPTDGVPGGYLTDEGPGTLSPHLFLIRMAGPAPA